MHVRGPAKLKQFAVYTPNGSSNSKRSATSARRHAHAHAHAHKREAEAAVGDTVYATIDGKAVSWANDWSGSAAPPAPEVNNKAYAGAASSPAAHSSESSAPSAPASTSSSAPASKSSSSGGILDDIFGSSSSGSWGRQAYYNAESGEADGLVFLNHNGGSGSGVFDYSFGNSLSYARADGKGGSSSP